MTDLMAVASELSKMRTIAQKDKTPGDIRQCYAEVLLLDRYNRLPSIADFKRKSQKRVALLPKDTNGLLTRAIAADYLPWRVYKSWVDADVLVFIKTQNALPMSQILGWLPRELVVQMPVRNDAYQVDVSFLIPMPNEFAFVEPEHHINGIWNGAWSYDEMGWECFACGRFVPDKKTRESAERELG